MLPNRAKREITDKSEITDRIREKAPGEELPGDKQAKGKDKVEGRRNVTAMVVESQQVRDRVESD